MCKFLATGVFLAAQLGAQNVPVHTPANNGAIPRRKHLERRRSAQGGPVFRSTTHLVEVNVIVRHRGEPVADLKKEDFKLFDNGKPQTISVFSVASTSGALPTSPVKLPPGVYTNKLMSKPGTPQSVTVILLDMYNLKIQDQMFARQQVVKFLRRSNRRIG